MSHSTLGVILPLGSDIGNVETIVADLLAPFDENLSVPEYGKPCYCIGSVARNAAYEQTVKIYGANPHQTVSEAEWQAWHDKFVPAYEAATEAHPDSRSPNPDCSDCHGTGVYQSTYNPKSKWDWYTIGGRWAGDLAGHELTEAEYDDKKVHTFWKHPAVNIANVQSLLDKTPLYTFFALLTPDGEWFEKGDMGWWGMVSDEKQPEDWEKISRAVYTKFAAHQIVLVDVHI